MQNIADAPGAAVPSESADAVPQTEIPTVDGHSRRSSVRSPRSSSCIGGGDENGVRLKLNFETPSLNSFVYEYMTPTC